MGCPGMDIPSSFRLLRLFRLSPRQMFSSSAVITGGTFIQQTQRVENQHAQQLGPNPRGGFERLYEAVSPAAFHDRFDITNHQSEPHTDVLTHIMDWVSGNGASESDSQIQSGQAFMMVVYAAPGTRIALAQTIAERCQQGNTLLASFFFSHADASRNHARSLVATISYQVALTLPAAKELIVAAVERDPLIFFKSLETQFLRLVIEPLHSASNHLDSPGSSLPHLVVIDVLDECDDEVVRTRILRLLFRTHREGALPPKVRFLLTTQPTSDVTAIISSQPSNDATTCLMLTGAYHRDEDIRLFLHNRFQHITADHPKRADIPSGWPSNHDVEELVRRASGQFIYALTVIRYVSSESHNPTTRLGIVLSLRRPRRHSLFPDLDALYTHILSTVDNINAVLRILGQLF
ncbi:hypothetical protein GALMADRAFT_714976 [Galerina marginata CBS 339.88]|uniref:Nephrocystin 3-like N-terminal domain-containing protein n=1 Tax=Galerina marginata (strain CBS 339.88) TaxID=685588 RepID=A0A067TMR3_GALM3|nr:hypothetical protein GALMADRAFT_714976 [Galerina marginata CBS 339.88]